MSDISVNVEYLMGDGDRPLSKTIKGLLKNDGLRELSERMRIGLGIEPNVTLVVKLVVKVYFPPNQGNQLSTTINNYRHSI